MTQHRLRLFVDERWQSPYSYSVLGAMREKQLEFDLQPIHFKDGRYPDAQLAGKTWTDLIPALQHDEFVLSESLAILEYLEESFPERRIFPPDRRDRARARFLLSWYRCGFVALREERSTETVFHLEHRAKRPLSAAAQEEVADWMKALRELLKPGAEFLFGSWSIADSETALMLHRLIRNGDEVDPALRSYAEQLWKRPSAAEFVNHARPPFV